MKANLRIKLTISSKNKLLRNKFNRSVRLEN
jgi:hypothetical protein